MGLLTDIIHEKLEHSHSQEDQRNQELRKHFGTQAYDYSLPESVRQNARDQLGKLYNPGAKKSFGKIGQFLDGVVSRFGQKQMPGPGGQQDQSQAAAPTATGTSDESGGLAAVPAPAPVQSAGSRALPPPAFDYGYLKDADVQAAQQRGISSELTKAKAEEAHYGELADQAGLTGRDKAQYIATKGQHIPTAVRPSGVAQKHDQAVEAQRVVVKSEHPDWGDDQVEEEARLRNAKALTALKAHNLQAGWAKYPGSDTLHAIRTDPQNPGVTLDAGTGKPVPDGAEQVNPSIITGQMRQDSYGSFGNFYRAAKGQGQTDEQARETAGTAVFHQLGVQLGRQEQNMAIDALATGVGGGADTSVGKPSGKPATAPATAPPAPTPRATTSSATAPTAPALSAREQQWVGQYLAHLSGAATGGGKGDQIGITQGRNILAKMTGQSPTEFAANEILNKDKYKALGENVSRSAAVNRLGNMLDGFGDLVIKNAKKIAQTGSPLLNRPIRSIGREISGDPDLKQFMVNLTGLQRQYGTLTAGGGLSKAMLPVGVGEDMQKLMGPDITLGEAIAVVNAVKQETATEKAAFEKSISDLTGEIKGSPLGAAAGGSKFGSKQLPGPAGSVDIDAKSQALKDRYKLK